MDKDFHFFQTDHLFFKNLGLSVFTSGSLLDWWSDESNRLLIKNAKDEDLKKVLGILGCRNADANGRCNQLTENIPIYWDGFVISPTYPTIGVYEQKTILTQRTGELVLNGWVSSNGFTANALCIEALKLIDNPAIRGLGVLAGLIKLNEVISALNQRYGYKRVAPLLNPGNLGLPDNYVIITSNGNLLKAANELLQEIKNSKSGYVTLLGQVRFTIYPYDTTIDDDVDFRLFLLDEKNSDISESSIALSDFKLVGQTTVINDGEASTQTKAGRIDLPFNPRTNKYESGPYIFFAKLETDIDSALDFTTIPGLRNQDIAESLKSKSSEEKLIPSTGTAIPFVSHNGNELQWAPQYELDSVSRCEPAGPGDDMVKKTYVVYNNSPSRKFKAGELVQIVWAGGRWNVMPVEEPMTEEEELDSIPGQRWGEFTYFMTNSNFFFTSEQSYKSKEYEDFVKQQNNVQNFPIIKFSPRDAELSFHRDYYFLQPDIRWRDQNLNQDYGLRGGYSNFNTKNINNFNRVSLYDGFWQVTSFDFLDSKVFGLKEGSWPFGACSIAHTNADRDSRGGNISHPPEEYATRNAAHCGLFFGCIFPDGYEGFEEYRDIRSFFVKAFRDSDFFFIPEDQALRPFSTFDGIPNTGNFTDIRTSCLQATRGSRDSDFSDPDELAWERNKNYELSYDVFYDQNTLNSVPADVMLNAAPHFTENGTPTDTKNGSPIRSIHALSPIHFPVLGEGQFTNVSGGYVKLKDSYQEIINDIINKKGNWLYREYIPGHPLRRDGNSDSAFDFKPKDPNHIMFRPLKFEAYTQFVRGDDKLISEAAANLNKFSRDELPESVGGEALKKIYQLARLRFLLEGWRTQFMNSQPFATKAFNREKKYAQPFTKRVRNGVIGFDPGALDLGPYLIGEMRELEDEKPAATILLWGGDVITKPGYRNLHRGDYWKQFGGAMAWTETYLGRWGQGAGAFGVITTSKTVAARNSIEITTDNRYGMGAQAEGKFTIEGGHASQYRTWGVSSFQDSYRQENIHDLSVRIYHNHPSNQTIFDPRTFAVHHFNPRVDLAIQSKAEEELKKRIEYVSVEGFDRDGNPIEFFYLKTTPITSVDIPIPSRFVEFLPDHVPVFDYIAELIPVGTFIFSDCTWDGEYDDSGENKIKNPEVISQEFWLSDLSRIGKLLPYRYYANTIGIPCDVGQIISDGEGIIYALDLNQPRDVGDNLVIFNDGIEYSVGDIVGNRKLEILFSVASVDSKGSIKSLKCIDAGELPPSMTSKFGSKFSKGEFGPIAISDTILSVRGRGFSSFYAVSRVNLRERVDPKPKLIHSQDQVRVASNVSEPKHGFSGSNRSIEPNAFVQESRSVSFQINDSNKSSNSLYDIFFHFHNDITMTWLASNQDFHGNVSNASEALEQFISARITVT
jgi:hypothetical protein